MTGLAVIGVQWGDEGKGKIVDWLMADADIAVRYQGGHNAGHTLVVDGRTYRLNLLPSGVVRRKISVIGGGVVVDPWKLLEEISALADRGIALGPPELLLADNACLILPWHGEIDAAREAALAGSQIGTTRRGIGPAYEDKIGRRAIRVADLADRDAVGQKLDRLMVHHGPLRAGLGLSPPDRSHILGLLMDIAPRMLAHACPVEEFLHDAAQAGKRILFEGAQGMMLDVDHGSYPYVTSSNIGAGHAATGAGVGPGTISGVLGVLKAYTTRVGSGPLPTELFDETGKKLAISGKEFGTVTSRARRCGWFDAVSARQACRRGGVDALALTKLDVLDGLETIRICTSYKCGEKTMTRFPAGMSAQQELVPVYEDMEGWTERIEGMRHFADLPSQARAYVERIQHLLGLPVCAVSTSPEREDMIILSHPFAEGRVGIRR